jgi:hypothetical protein
MSIVRGMLDKIDEKFRPVEGDSKIKAVAKAATGGFIEGAIDGIFVESVLLMAVGCVVLITNKKEE